jgi:hypothetical protein
MGKVDNLSFRALALQQHLVNRIASEHDSSIAR